MFSKNLYNTKDARQWRQSLSSLLADKELGERIYTSRLIGQNPDLLMHGGGNTSVKVKRSDIFGNTEDIIHIKGSGWDLDTIEAAGLPGVRLKPLLKLKALKNLSDEDMVNIQRNNLIDSSSPNPSVETLLHAFLPHKFVDHTHATPFLILANLPNAREICEEIFSKKLAVIPYIMPGFKLAKKAESIFNKNPDVEGLLLLNHGHFTFGQTAQESYNRIISHTNAVAKYFGLKDQTKFGQKKGPIKNFEFLPVLRGLIAQINGGTETGMPIFNFRNNSTIENFFNRTDLIKLQNRGMASPDHVIRTKGRPLFLTMNDIQKGSKKIRKKLLAFRSDYEKYFIRQVKKSKVSKKMLKADPKHVWLEGIGILGVGADAKSASIAADLAEQNVIVRDIGENFGGFYPIKEKDMFECEYWSLEQAKLGKGEPLKMQGKVVMITGGAGAIGLATAKAFSQLGASIFLVDKDKKMLRAAHRKLSKFDGFLSCDVTKKGSARKAVEACTLQFGGLDILISNAGGATAGAMLEMNEKTFRNAFELNFFSHKSFALEATKILRLQNRGGKIIFNISKQAINPGENMGAYGIPKASTMFLMRQLALELGETGISVNGVNADRIRSGLLTDKFIKQRAKSRGVSEKAYMEGNLLKSEVTASHVADAFVALANMERTTGHVLTVDGGNTAAELR